MFPLFLSSHPYLSRLTHRISPSFPSRSKVRTALIPHPHLALLALLVIQPELDSGPSVCLVARALNGEQRVALLVKRADIVLSLGLGLLEHRVERVGGLTRGGGMSESRRKAEGTGRPSA
jgi:hypothetical protein